MAEDKPMKGVKTRILGVVLIFLGSLDAMLSWLGGFPPSAVHLALLAAGAFLFALGAARNAGADRRHTEVSK